MNFLTSFFAQPLMLWGTLLVSVPIIIYLINRQRYQRKRWAAMEFLLRAMQKNRRRIQLENVLLLLIRCLILALLAAAMARPFVRSAVLGNLSVQPENWILALDTSYSMGWKSGTRTLFETAKETMAQMVQVLMKPGDRVSVVTLEARPHVVVQPRQVTESGRADIMRAISEVEPGYSSVHVGTSLSTILDVAREFEAVPSGETPLSGKKLILFSDFQRRDWLQADAQPDAQPSTASAGAASRAPFPEPAAPGVAKDPAIGSLLRELNSAGIQVSWADLKGSDRNLLLEELTVSPTITSQDMWVQFLATVRNFGREDFDAVELSFSVDGIEERTYVIRVPAGGSVTRLLPYRFQAAGHHAITAEIRGDGLATDNRRHLAVRVRENADILLVDGDPGESPLEHETLFLSLALMPEESDEFRRSPFRPVLMTVDQILADSPELRPYSAVILANVRAADFPERFLGEIHQYVRDGGALMIFLGNNVTPQDYNNVFHRAADDMLPVPILEQVESDTLPVHLEIAGRNHPVGRYFLDRIDSTNLGRPFIDFRRYFRLQTPDPDSPVAVLMRFDDPGASPAVLDAPFGRGRVMWVASSADQDWNDFAKYWDYVPFIHESIQYLVQFGESRINLALGEPYRETFEARDYAPEVLILPPAAESTERPLGGAAIPKQLSKIPDENRFLLLHEETGRPGVYEVRLQRPAGAPGDWDRRKLLFAVNVDPFEGDLRAATIGEVEEAFPDFKAQVFDAVQEVQEIAQKKVAAGGTELWRAFLWAVLLLLAAESLLGLLFGRRLR